MTAVRAGVEDLARTFNKADTASNAAGRRPQIVFTAPGCCLYPWGVQIDQLHLGKAREPRNPRWCRGFNASFSPWISWTMRPFWRSIDGISIRDVPGCRACGGAVEIGHARLGVMEDRRGQRRVRQRG